jgi:hypothetical protein
MYATSGGVGPNKKFFSNGSQKINIISNSQVINSGQQPMPNSHIFLPTTSQSTSNGIGAAMNIVGGF